ncbi:hypothetical protein DYU05_01620 [Mucilaginibacter terrenus]|uniref:Uncharacterized protein n=1 Tax=Mucilaginibacter terrenus TaxID=2482727 RepID=A0A3E2NTV7_9SPHI|nr:hypothetical protein [Mucilaginibacter terrenus]RFZ84351.1 hypothetical protein DYU05_01620 [Mucilaginibacter terrenus]
MERHKLTITKDKELYQFEVSDHPHHEREQCKFDVFKDGELVASFDPDEQHILHVCKNLGKVPEEVLHLLADKIEAHHWI